MNDNPQSRIAGHLRRESPSLDLWVSAPLPVPFFNSKPVEVMFDCENKGVAQFLSEADEALGKFLRVGSDFQLSLSERVYKICSDYIGLIGLRESIEDY